MSFYINDLRVKRQKSDDADSGEYRDYSNLTFLTFFNELEGVSCSLKITENMVESQNLKSNVNFTTSFFAVGKFKYDILLIYSM